MSLFLGIDGGQSATTVLIGDEQGRVMGRSRSGPCNHVSAPEAGAKFTRVITAGIFEAGFDPAATHFESACCGMSGGPDDKRALLARVVRAGKLSLVTDGEIALAGAMVGGPGIIVIAGTGSIAYGRGEGGKLVRAGGWGYIFGDEGSAFDIARQAARAALRFEEGWGNPTALHSALLEATGAGNANEMLHLFYTPEWPRSRVAGLAALVDTVSADGDVAARNILEQAAQNLASLAGFVRSHLAHLQEVSVAYVGGVFRSRVVLERFRMLVELTDGCKCIAPVLSPAEGALLMARRAVGLAC
jgi:N-acetylglucosamine kinase-like BadF-type ATPase